MITRILAAAGKVDAMEYSSSKGPLLDDHEQEMVTTFRGTGGRPVLPRHAPNSLTRPTAKLKEFVSCQYDPAMLNDPFVALYNEPSRDKSDERKYFCEACTVRMPAREQDWQMHTSGLVHKAQIISLSQTSELGHLPSPYTGES